MRKDSERPDAKLRAKGVSTDSHYGSVAGEPTTKRNRYETTNCCSRLTWTFVRHLLKIGRDHPLQQEDLEMCPRDDSAEFLYHLLKNAFEVRKKKNLPISTAASLWYAFGPIFIRQAIWQLLSTIAGFTQVLAVRELVMYVEVSGEGYEWWYGYAAATVLSLSNASISLVNHTMYFNGFRMGMHIRTALSLLIFDKALKMSMSAFGQTTTGQLMNLISSDINKFDCPDYQSIWSAPLLLPILVLLLWREIGEAALVGLGLLLIFMPLQTCIGGMFGRFRGKMVEHTDQRVRLLSELLSAADIVKLYNWEEPLENAVAMARAKEFEYIKVSGLLRAVNFALFYAGSVITPAVTFMGYVFLGNNLNNPSAIFTSLVLLNFVRTQVTSQMPRALEKLSESSISCIRLNRFFQLEENSEKDFSINPFLYETGKTPIVVLENAFFLWQDPPINNNKNNNKSKSKSRDEKNTFSSSKKKTSFFWACCCRSKNNNKKIDNDGSNSKCDSNIEDVNLSPRRPSQPDILSTSSSASANTAALIYSKNGLKNISLKIFPSQLVAICGPVGSYKSSLLAAILGEMPCAQGLLWSTPGKKSFASQKPFILEGTIRENILFGRKLDRGYYAEVLHACCLEEDLAGLPAGDFTGIGERGVNLSGGQRARIALARVVYAKDAALFLFDDVLSAVDPIVAQMIFDRVLGSRGILKKHTRILVTHQTQFLPHTDSIVLLEQGKIVAQGTYKELVESNKLNIAEEKEKENNSSSTYTNTNNNKITQEDIEEDIEFVESIHNNTSFSYSQTHSQSQEINQQRDRHAIIVAEQRDQGQISLHVWKTYFNASGCCFLLLSFLTLVFAQLGFNACDLWLSFWSSQQFASFLTENEYLYIYASLVGLTVILLFFRAWFIMRVLVQASATLHNKMFHGLLYSPLRFYEQNPAGRILNRLTKDQAVLDEILPVNLLSLLGVTALVIGMLGMAFYALPYILIVLIFAIPLFIYLRNYYLISAREIKRLDALSRSPIFSLFSATLSGLPVVRAFQSEKIITEQFHKLVDKNTQAYFALLVCVRWLGFRLDMTCALFIASSAFFAVYSTTVGEGEMGGDIGGARIALGLSYVIGLTGWFQFVVRQGAEVENDMTSTERIVAYTRLPNEGERYLNSPPPEWPQRGLLVFQNVSMRYRPELPLVIRSVNLRIEPKQKIGVCGRTGAGKSSLFQVCFRLVELMQGEVLIDNIPIHTIGLADLRSKLAIIPQNAAIFSGTIRYNLDPFESYSDSQIWDALKDVQLYEKIQNLPDGLYTTVAEQGGNFSAGEGQLICIARCILRPSRILFVDEATANVDPETDMLIQRVIRAKFVDRTVITIAHRLTTILDSDMILVMDAGQVVEFAPPETLIQNPDSFFCQLRSGKLGAKAEATPRNQPAIIHSSNLPQSNPEQKS